MIRRHRVGVVVDRGAAQPNSPSFEVIKEGVSVDAVNRVEAAPYVNIVNSKGKGERRLID